MTSYSRRHIINRSVIGVAASAVALRRFIQPASAQYAVNASDALMESTADAPWQPAKVIDTNAMDWEAGRLWDRKVVYWNPDSGSHIMLLYIPPGWEGAPNHYHYFHEWAYILQGDITNNEYIRVC